MLVYVRVYASVSARLCVDLCIRVRVLPFPADVLVLIIVRTILQILFALVIPTYGTQINTQSTLTHIH
jgi:hypothetical protein